MKRIICTMLLLVFTLCMVGCNNEKYKLTLEGAEGNLVYPLKESYRAGEKVEVVTEICFDADLVIYLNDEPIEKTCSDRPYWKYEFIMPNKDSVLRFSIEGGLPYYYGIYNEYGFYYIPGENDVETTETIDRVKFNYNDSGKIYGCKNDEQLTLQECFDRGIITHDNLVEINELHKNDFPFMYEDEDTYTLNEIIQCHSSDIIDISYSLKDYPEYLFYKDEVVSLINVAYYKLPDNVEIEPLNTLGEFKIYTNDRIISFSLLTTNVICFNTDYGIFFSKKTVELLEEQVPDTIWLHYEESWLQEIKAEDISEILVETGGIGVEPGSPTIINKTNDKEEITRLLTEWNNVTLNKVNDDSWMVPGGGFKYVMFKHQNGTFYTIQSDNGFYNTTGVHYEISNFPMISEDKITSTEEGQVGKLGNIDFVVSNIEDSSNDTGDDALEFFYGNLSWQYYFSYIKSHLVTVYYENGLKENVKEALRSGRIQINELDKYNIEYISLTTK